MKKKKKKLKLKLLTTRPKPKISGEEDDEKYLQQISDADDVWDWTVFYNIQEIIIPLQTISQPAIFSRRIM